MKKPTDTSSRVEAEDFAREAARGSAVLQAADAAAVQEAGLVHDVLAFSLYGNDPGYGECAVLSAQRLPEVYPGWQMWLFHDDSVPLHLRQRLQALGVRLLHAGKHGIGHWPGTFWRFDAVTHAGVRRVLFRDADSVIGAREQRLVHDWLASGRPFHVMRDWYSHTDLILAGLWGAWAPFLAHMREWVDHYLATHRMHPTHGDQKFLADIIWPRIRDHALVHDSLHSGPGITPFDPPDHAQSGQNALGGYRVKRLDVSLEQAVDWPYRIRILDRHGLTICDYERRLRQGHDSFHLPYELHDEIAAGRWRLLIEPQPPAPEPPHEAGPFGTEPT